MNYRTRLIIYVFFISGSICLIYRTALEHEYLLKTSKYDPPQRYSMYDDRQQQREVLGFLRYKADLKMKFRNLLARNASAMDPDLISFVREVLDHPAPPNQIKMSRNLLLTPQTEEIDIILKQKVNGFFVEAGALDGERSSNTIWLEKKRGWTGLLVEPDPYFYTQLIGKNRNAWSINGCISPYNYVSEIPFEYSLAGHGKLDLKKYSRFPRVPCYPLLTLLAAINVSTVDFFSLDVEGAEGQILESLPMNKLNISTLAVEYVHGDKSWYVELMDKKGYKIVKDLHVVIPEAYLFVDDFIFAKKELNILD